MKLLQNSVDIKTSKLENQIDKLKAIVLIEIKIVAKYENFITILLSQFYGKEVRNKKCQNLIFDYINKIEDIVKQGIKNGEIKQGDPKVIASEIYGLISNSIIYKSIEKRDINIMNLYREFESTLIEGLKK